MRENSAALGASWRDAHEERVHLAAQDKELAAVLRGRVTATRSSSRRAAREARTAAVQARIRSTGYASEATMRREELYSRPFPTAVVSSPLVPPPVGSLGGSPATSPTHRAASPAALFGRPGGGLGSSRATTADGRGGSGGARPPLSVTGYSSQPNSPSSSPTSRGGGGSSEELLGLQLGPAGTGWPAFGANGELLAVEGLEADGTMQRLGWRIDRPDPHDLAAKNFVFGGGFVDAGLEAEDFPAWR